MSSRIPDKSVSLSGKSVPDVAPPFPQAPLFYTVYSDKRLGSSGQILRSHTAQRLGEQCLVSLSGGIGDETSHGHLLNSAVFWSWGAGGGVRLHPRVASALVPQPRPPCPPRPHLGLPGAALVCRGRCERPSSPSRPLPLQPPFRSLPCAGSSSAGLWPDARSVASPSPSPAHSLRQRASGHRQQRQKRPASRRPRVSVPER